MQAMNCCSQPPSSPSLTMAVSTKFDIEFDYDISSVGNCDRNYKTSIHVAGSEDERQEAALLDALSIVQTNQTLREARLMMKKYEQDSEKIELFLKEKVNVGQPEMEEDDDEEEEEEEEEEDLTPKAKPTKDEEAIRMEEDKENEVKVPPMVSISSSSPSVSMEETGEDDESETEESETEGVLEKLGDFTWRNFGDETETETQTSIKTSKSGQSSSILSKASSTSLLGQRIATPRHHHSSSNNSTTRIHMMASPSHLKEAVEMELPSKSLSSSFIRRSNTASTEGTNLSSSSYKDSKPSLSSSSSVSSATPQQQNPTQQQKQKQTQKQVDPPADREMEEQQRNIYEEATESTANSTEEELKRTREELKQTKAELLDSREELTDIREKAQVIKRELKIFHREWESQQTLMRNKDRELERLRLIIADRTLQLTEKTGELSITKVALMSSEHGLLATKKHFRSRTEELHEAQDQLKQLKKVLSATRVELSRSKLQLEAQAKRRKQFSNQALRILVGEADKDAKKDNTKQLEGSVYIEDSEDDDVITGWNTVETYIDVGNPESSARQRSKSWCFSSSSSTSSDEAMNLFLRDEIETYTVRSEGDRNYNNKAKTSNKREIGVQTSVSSADLTRQKRDIPLPRPSRCRSTSRDSRSRSTTTTSCNSKDHDMSSSQAAEAVAAATAPETPTTRNTSVENLVGEECQIAIVEEAYFDSLMTKVRSSSTTSVEMDRAKSSTTTIESSSCSTSAAMDRATSKKATEIANSSTATIRRAASAPANLGSAAPTTNSATSSYKTVINNADDSEIAKCHPDIEVTYSSVSHLTAASSDVVFTTDGETSTGASVCTTSTEVSLAGEEEDKSATSTSLIAKQEHTNWEDLLEQNQQQQQHQECGDASECDTFATTKSTDDTTATKTVVSSSFNAKRKRSTGMMILTAGFVAILTAMCSYCLYNVSHEVGITVVGGNIFISDFRTIISGVAIVFVLWVTTLWTAVESLLNIRC